VLPDQAVQHITNADIERLATQTWDKAQNCHSVELLAEQVLGYRIEITDEGIFADRNILGGISFETQTLFVNASVESHEGRYNFTVAHEIGHHVLHRELYLAAFAGQDGIMCREQAKKPLVERQADRFAAALLMPDNKIKNALRGRPTATTLNAALRLAKTLQINHQLDHVSLSALVNRLIDLGFVSDRVPYQTGKGLQTRGGPNRYPGWARFIYRIYRALRLR